MSMFIDKVEKDWDEIGKKLNEKYGISYEDLMDDILPDLKSCMSDTICAITDDFAYYVQKNSGNVESR